MSPTGETGDFEPEFVYRQACNVEELRAVILARSRIAGRPGGDGDSHRMPSLVRAWWRNRGHLLDRLPRP